MRLVIVNPVWDPAHATPMETLARFATLTGWATSVRASGAERVTVCQRFPIDAEVRRDGVEYFFCADRQRPSPRWTSRATSSMLTAIREAVPDLVHLNGLLFPELIRSIRTALPERVALVVQDHGGFEPADASAFTRVWLRRGLAAADAVLVASPGQAEALRDSTIAPRETLIADVMESSTTLVPVSRARARAELHMQGEPALLWVGRLNENKDPLTVLAAIARLALRHPRVTLTMAFHEGELAEQVRAAVAADPVLASRVTLVGAVPHDRLAAYYSAADAFIVGSHHEGSGYAAIEAMACGCVPIVTDIPSFRALTGDGAVGELWTPGDADGCARAIERALTRPLAEHREAVSARFAEHFSWPMVGRRAVRIYRDVIAARDRVRSEARTPHRR